ncbi:MAG: peptidyl-prolyl cis-trans isomerase [Fimbriimonas sp.]
MRKIELKKTWFAAALLLISGAAVAQVDPARTIAVINGEEIKGAEYYRKMEFLGGVGKRDGDNFYEAPPGFLTLEQLITERLVLQLAKQKGAFPTDIEVAAELKARTEDNPKLLTEWTALGRTAEELNALIRYELAQFKISSFGITVTDQEVEKFYKDNPTMYTVPKQVKLRVIVVEKDADKTAVDTALGAGKPFPDVAKQLSVDISRANGGEYGTVPLAMLSTPARTAVDAVKIGQATSWVSSQTADGGNRFVKFQVLDILPEKKLELDAKLRRGIRRRLMLDRGTVKNDIRKEMNALRAKAKIDIKEPQFAEIYKKFIEQYLKQSG